MYIPDAGTLSLVHRIASTTALMLQVQAFGMITVPCLSTSCVYSGLRSSKKASSSTSTKQGSSVDLMHTM
jgi:hypothetical protein